jgi:hypothetical protein
MIMTEYFYVCIGLRQHKWMTSPLSFSLYWFYCMHIIPIKIYNNNNNNNVVLRRCSVAAPSAPSVLHSCSKCSIAAPVLQQCSIVLH